MKYKFLLLFISTVCSTFGQYYIEGQNKFGLHWKQINTTYFQIIYEEHNEENAQYVANTLQTVYQEANESISAKLKKVSVILQNQGAVSNGFATLAPRRTEFYQTPSQDLNGLDWLQLLCIHEYRHVLQMDNYKEGVTKLITWITGEQGTGAILGLTTPLWFVEGDAVGTETALSQGGRGRLPKFEMELKAQFLELGAFNYEKSSFGSFKHYIPDYYKLGYHLTTYAKNTYGLHVWDSTLSKVAKNPFRLYPFSRCLKKVAGVSTKTLFEDCHAHLDSLWTLQNKHTDQTENLLIKEHKGFQNQLYPIQISQDSILYLEESYDDVKRFMIYRKSTQSSTILTEVALINEGRFAYKNNKIAYTRFNQHPRYSYSNYSEISIYNIKTNKNTTVDSRYKRSFSPTFSDDGSKIAFIEIDDQGNSHLIIYDLIKTKEIVRYPAPKQHQWVEPFWKGQHIVYIDFYEGKSQVELIDYSTGRSTPLSEASFENMQTPIIANNKVYLSAAFSGIQNIYQLDNFKFEMLSNSPFGAFNPSVNNDSIIYNSYHAMGYRMVNESSKTHSFIENKSNFYSKLVQLEDASLLLQNVSDSSYASKKYTKLSHLFKVHSWQPFYLNAETEEIGIGAGISSQNLLSTSLATLNYQFIQPEQRNITTFNYKYLGLYPIISLSLENQQMPYKINDLTFDVMVNSVSLTLNTPFEHYFKNFYLYHNYIANYAVQQTTYKLNDFELKVDRSSLELRQQFYWSKYKAKKDIKTPFSINLQSSIITSEKNTNSSFTFWSTISTKTLKHQNLSLSVNIQKNQTNTVSLINYNLLPVGYTFERHNEITFTSAEYSLPLAYPDLKLTNLIYIQRVRTNVGYQYANADGKEYQSSYIDLIFDGNLFRYSYLTNIGVKMIYLPSTNNMNFNFIFGVDF